MDIKKGRHQHVMRRLYAELLEGLRSFWNHHCTWVAEEDPLPRPLPSLPTVPADATRAQCLERMISKLSQKAQTAAAAWRTARGRFLDHENDRIEDALDCG